MYTSCPFRTEKGLLLPDRLDHAFRLDSHRNQTLPEKESKMDVGYEIQKLVGTTASIEGSTSRGLSVFGQSCLHRHKLQRHQ